MQPRSRQLCPKFEAAMRLLSRPWNGLLISALTERPHRFGELSEALAPIGDRILSQRLKELERLGLIERRVLPGPPVRVEYTITEAGRGFSSVEDAIRAWGEQVGAAILAAEPAPLLPARQKLEKQSPARPKKAAAR